MFLKCAHCMHIACILSYGSFSMFNISSLFKFSFANLVSVEDIESSVRWFFLQFKCMHVFLLHSLFAMDTQSGSFLLVVCSMTIATDCVADSPPLCGLWLYAQSVCI
ncbi:hypothetical protein CHS0354_021827 [Potamilus streckersoni]|uniref:Uncharacterized protein n=1 Tax=Potamilus streckersoni TaxID=2493646 RepID=A0AAE0S4F9_9BIVA|nr:hypothetical protein CHS0354_021827 [Potamilus streckersoni]